MPLEKEHDEVAFGRCLCFTLRRGVLFFTVLEALLSLIGFFGLITDDLRPLAQGYSPRAQLIAALLSGGVGLFVTLVWGTLGVFDASADRLQTFVVWLYVKMALIFALYISDLRVLATCEKGSAQTARNVFIRDLRIRGACNGHLIGTTLVSLVHVLFLLLGLRYTTLLRDTWVGGPRYKINFNRDSLFLRSKGYDAYQTV